MGLYEYVRSMPECVLDPQGLKVLDYKNCDASQRRAIQAADKAATQRAAALADFFKNRAYKMYEDFVRFSHLRCLKKGIGNGIQNLLNSGRKHRLG
jgi:hypothetical protein